MLIFLVLIMCSLYINTLKNYEKPFSCVEEKALELCRGVGESRGS